ncbi:MAG: tRNA pseudouridine(38-40) synthase TruA, partial [bacterium]
MRLLLKIEYDGTRFHGWQIQPNVLTVQGALEDAMGQMMAEPVRIIGSGRTDAGVHALGQVAHCDVPRNIPTDNIRMGLNSILPEDVRILECSHAPDGFHAQFRAIGKKYTYQILNRQNPTALDRNRVWHLRHPLDLDAMAKGAGYLIGKKDFASFKSTGDNKTTVRDLKELSISREGDLITMVFEANGFLKY